MNQLKYSAVLNPIKNLQAILKKEIYRRFLNLLERPNSQETLQYLIQCAKVTWDQIREHILNKLIDTMGNRVQAIIEAKGWYTKYQIL